MKKLVLLAVGSLSLVALAASGCKKTDPGEVIAEKIIEVQTGGKADVDVSGGTVTVTSTQEGQEGTMQISSGADLKLAADFPGDVPIYPKAALLSQMTMGSSRQVVFRSADRGAEVYAFYQKQLAGEGWSVVQQMQIQTPPSFTLVGQKGQRQAAVVIAQDKEETTISITISENQG